MRPSSWWAIALVLIAILVAFGWATADGWMDFFDDSTSIAQRGGVNLISGDNVTVTGADNPSENRVDYTLSASVTSTKGAIIEDVVAGDDFPLWQSDRAITLSEVCYLVLGGDTNWIGQLVEMDANGANPADVHSSDITVVAGTTNCTSTFSNAGIDADDWMGIETTSASGTPDTLNITWVYTDD